MRHRAAGRVKTTKSGAIIHGQGIRPCITKPTTELVLAGSTSPRGRPLPILDEGMGQVVLAPRPGPAGGRHSAKPEQIRANIERLYGNGYRRIELFTRERAPGWVSWGNQLDHPEQIP